MKMICVVLFTVALFGTSESCSCSIIGGNAQYCHAEFGVIARVIQERESTEGEERLYDVEIINDLKDNISGPNGTIHTSKLSSLCSATLDYGSTYLLAGRFVDGHMNLGPCQVVRQMHTTDIDTYIPPPCF